MRRRARGAGAGARAGPGVGREELPGGGLNLSVFVLEGWEGGWRQVVRAGGWPAPLAQDPSWAARSVPAAMGGCGAKAPCVWCPRLRVETCATVARCPPVGPPHRRSPPRCLRRSKRRRPRPSLGGARRLLRWSARPTAWRTSSSRWACRIRARACVHAGQAQAGDRQQLRDPATLQPRCALPCGTARRHKAVLACLSAASLPSPLSSRALLARCCLLPRRPSAPRLWRRACTAAPRHTRTRRSA